MLKDFTPRIYQETILNTTSMHNTLVVLPTGLGKTAVAMMLCAQRMSVYPGSKTVILAPTKPLCEQHQMTIQKHLGSASLFTGRVAPKKRAELFKDSKIIVSTPQGFENDLINKKIDLKDVSLVVFDEAHHATGDYSYVWIAEKYKRDAAYPRILALTASPGSSLEKIQEVCSNLFIEKIEARTDDDPDVSPYIKNVNKKYEYVNFLPELQLVKDALTECYTDKMQALKTKGFIHSIFMSKTEMIALQGKLAMTMGMNFEAMKALSLLAQAMKVQHAIELIETQGLPQVFTYIDNMIKSASTSKVKAVKNLSVDPYFRKAWLLSESLIQRKIEHPKLTRLREIVNEHKGSKMIIFTQYRNTGVNVIKNIDDAKLFVGQMKKGGTGMSQKEQQQMLQDFRENKFKILVCTSVGEEGLDIPMVDRVIFYEPIPSAIRTIQRRGRTGRHDEGYLTVLITKGTRDEAYQWSSHHKEKRMMRTIKQLNSTLLLKRETLLPFVRQNIKIIADSREKNSGVVKELLKLGVDVSINSLQSADYLCSSETGVEFKTASDFVNSIIDGRLVNQLKNLVRFKRPILMIQMDTDIYSVRNVHPNSIRGMIATIAVSYGIAMIYTKDYADSAAMLMTIAKREQARQRDVQTHQKRNMTLQETQEYVVSSLPNVGLKSAKLLLNHFKSIKGIFNASVDELTLVEGIGKTIAKRVKETIKSDYV